MATSATDALKLAASVCVLSALPVIDEGIKVPASATFRILLTDPFTL